MDIDIREFDIPRVRKIVAQNVVNCCSFSLIVKWLLCTLHTGKICFYAPASINHGHIAFGLSICQFVCLQKLLHWP